MNLSDYKEKISHQKKSIANNITKSIDINELLVLNNSSTFIIESNSDSMINAFIPPNAKLVVDSSLDAKNGDIVLATIHGKPTVKYFKKNNYKSWLIPANSKYQEVEITEAMDLTILGVVTRIITNTRDLSSLMI